jgi:ABC-type multidrug transport system permease subunit
MNHPLLQLLLARLRGFYREPVALFWVYGFPMIMALGLGIAFSSRKPDPARVDVQEGDGDDDVATQLELAGMTVEVHSAEECRQRRRIGTTALYVIAEPGAGWSYVYDEADPEAVRARYQVDAALVRTTDDPSTRTTAREVLVTEKGNRYIDFLMPGLIGLNLMGGGLWGIGFVIVDQRVRKLLKRLVATPMRRAHFLLAMLLGRLILLVPDMAVLLSFACLVFGVPLRGSLLTLALVILAGAAAFSGIGLLIACRTEKTETVSGLMNLVMLPMWLLSGTFFSSKRFPAATQPFVQALPLTQLNDALREVMLEGAGLTSVAWHIGILAAFALVTFTLALRWFRWQ